MLPTFISCFYAVRDSYSLIYFLCVLSNKDTVGLPLGRNVQALVWNGHEHAPGVFNQLVCDAYGLVWYYPGPKLGNDIGIFRDTDIRAKLRAAFVRNGLDPD
jgi:hypothetical protein